MFCKQCDKSTAQRMYKQTYHSFTSM